MDEQGRAASAPLGDFSGAPPARPVGLSRRRKAAGLIAAVVGLALLTLALEAATGVLSLVGQAMVYLLAVVILAVVGGSVIALPAAVVSALLINFFFVDPQRTLEVARADDAVALVVFVAVAAIVSATVELSARRARAARQAARDAETLSALAGSEFDRRETLDAVLQRARRTFDMDAVALEAHDRESGEWREVAHAGTAARASGSPTGFTVAAGRLRLVGRGRAPGAEDQRVLHAFASAAQTAYEGRRLSERAEEGRTLAAVDRQRISLLAAVGHDLRTPLAAIKAAVSTLRQTDVEWTPSDREALLATIEESSDRLDSVVANLLDASRLQAGVFSVHSVPVALDEVVSGAILAVPGADARVRVHVSEDLPLVLADPGLLERIFVNLLDNALRHGGTAAPVEVRAVAGGEAAKVEVVDHGPGVPPEERQRLFEPFQRVDDRSTVTGVGLGLSVARGFAEAMGGALVADQAPGGGLLMRVRLPLAPVREPSASPGETTR